jgi:hypothetical protein
MSSKPGKRARATAQQLEQELFELADQLEQELLKLKPLVKILKAVGVDPASTAARRLVTFIVASLYYGINRIEIQPRQAVPSAAKWTLPNEMALMIEVVDRLKQGNISEREAIKQIAKKPRDNHPSLAHRFPYKSQGRSEAGRRSSQSTAQERREEALWQRWLKIKKAEKARAKIIAELPPHNNIWLEALGFGPPTGEK